MNQSYRVALGIQYDGTTYHGWQSQPNKNTVQDCLEIAIDKFLGVSNTKSVNVVAAGRTDSGVHALGQVVHFDTLFERENWSWVRGINTFLPKDIAVHWAKVVPAHFDARFSAQERAYAYCLSGTPYPLPLLKQKTGYFMLPTSKELDVLAMRQAASHLLGTHDFSSFRSSECQSNTPVKTIYQLEIVEQAPHVYFFIRGNAFLHHMVRNLVGSLLRVGLGKESSEWLLDVLNKRDRQCAAPTFMADGLYLCRVGYPLEFQIPEPNLSTCVIPGELLNHFIGPKNWILNEV